METSQASPALPERQRIVCEATMDLFLLRQIRGSEYHFQRGSTVVDDPVLILSSQVDWFLGLKKKGASDRPNLLLAKFQAKEAGSKSASGVKEDYSATDSFLTEL